MARSFKEAIQHRRTHYGIGNNSPISDNEIHEIIKTAVTHVPSAFNSQSTRIVLLLGESHKKLWEIVIDTLRKIVPADAYKATEAKIDNSFEAGYGTVLFFEDTAVSYRRDAHIRRDVLELHIVLQVRIRLLEPLIAHERGLSHNLADLPHLRIRLLRLLRVSAEEFDGVRQLLHDRAIIKILLIGFGQRLKILVEPELVLYSNLADVRMPVAV